MCPWSRRSRSSKRCMRSAAMSDSLGLLAEFDAPQPLVDASLHAWVIGYRRLEAFAPFALEAFEPILATHARRVPHMACVGAVIGIVLALVMQIGSVLAYPLNVGGRPLIALPSFMVVTFLFAVVGAALAAVLAMLIGSRLPRLHHPLFNIQRFAQASDDGFFLFIAADDPLFDAKATRDWLGQCAVAVHEVRS
ncbi:DUF3341 domain-containing protein [Pseudomonas syringae]|nr:DUF3341 domain-containing protein [Pseudomonas syringae]MCF5071619.1 DUF3341 domain-containing protein [Pseudomonas syringae]